MARNKVYKGHLWTYSDFTWYKKQKTRFVGWGKSGFAFNYDIAKSGNKVLSELNIFDFCNDFHNFLFLLHTLNNSRYVTSVVDRGRYFNKAPSLQFDYHLLKHKILTLEKYELSLEKLRVLIKNVADVAIQFDPLEYWYYYIHRHPQWRKDLFKGEALLAQELYSIIDIFSDVAEIVSGEKQPPLFDLLYGEKNLYPYLTPKSEYVNGTDVKSLWSAINKFKEWAKLESNVRFVDRNTLDSLKVFEKRLEEYESKYGAKSFISNGIRAVEIEEDLKIDDLDPVTRQYVDQTINQTNVLTKDGKNRFISMWGDELEGEMKRKETTREQAKKKDYDLFIKSEIFEAIERRLDTLKRELWTIFDTPQKLIAKETNNAWDLEHNFGNNFWFRERDNLNKLTKEDQQALYKTEYKKVYENAQYWSNKRDEFAEVEYTMSLLFCSKCRERPVQLQQGHLDQSINTKPICDSCLSKDNELSTMKLAEWHCTNCGELIYKFAYGNKFESRMQNSVLVRFELKYGRIEIIATCKKCGEKVSKSVEWGWMA